MITADKDGLHVIEMVVGLAGVTLASKADLGPSPDDEWDERLADGYQERVAA